MWKACWQETDLLKDLRKTLEVKVADSYESLIFLFVVMSHCHFATVPSAAFFDHIQYIKLFTPPHGREARELQYIPAAPKDYQRKRGLRSC